MRKRATLNHGIQKQLEKLKKRLKKATQKTSPLSAKDRLTKFNEIFRGWINSCRLANISANIKKVDVWLRNRFRDCIWHDWKKPDRKRKQFDSIRHRNLTSLCLK